QFLDETPKGRREMGLTSKLAASSDLAKGMADRLGIDLSRITSETCDFGTLAFRGVALHCATCPDQASCTALQRAHPTLERPPAYCRNYALFDRLARR
ncbi:MAG: DUF6455 family protein, partial [Pseudomonadota bacterium]